MEPPPRVVFVPDRPVDRPGDLFPRLVEDLGLGCFRLAYDDGPSPLDGEVGDADFVAFIGLRRATRHLGFRPRTGRLAQRLGRAQVYVLPSTAPEERGRFYEGVWRSFAAHVQGRDLAVRDEYKNLAPDQIREALAPRRFNYAVLIANVAYDINVGSIIRTANALLAREILLYGRRKTDLRGAMGCHVYETLVHVPDADALGRYLHREGRSLVCVEQAPDAVPLPRFTWPARPVIAFGQEGPGIPDEVRRLADALVVIPQYGSVRSLNAGVAAGIALYDWHAKRLGGGTAAP